jgi:hypothetical protein
MTHRKLTAIPIQQSIRLKVSIRPSRLRFKLSWDEYGRVVRVTDGHLRLEHPKIGRWPPLLRPRTAVDKKHAHSHSLSAE